MAERRLPFTVRDDGGVGRRGEIVIVRAWRPDLELDPDAAFTIVLASQRAADPAGAAAVRLASEPAP